METSQPRRAPRRARKSEPSFIQQPFGVLHNPFPPLEMLDPSQLDTIHQASLHILENTGIKFMDAEVLQLWAQAGAKVDHSEQMVYIDRGLLMELVARAPSQFTWRARNPQSNIVIGGSHTAFAPNGGMAYISSLDAGRRPGLFSDYEDLTRLAQACSVIHFNGGELIAMQDIHPSTRHLKRLYADFTLSDKALIEAAHGRIISQDVIDMAALVFGDIESGPALGGVINSSSPLRYDDRMASGLITFARHNQAVIVTPFIMAGAMAPITIAAALAQQNAEALAGIALAQIVRPGAPAIYGGFTTNVDMRSGSPAFGTPEGAWALLVGAQLARHYRLPYRGSGSLNTAKSPDAQAAYETLWTMWPAILAHTHFILHSIGWLEGGLTVSLEKYVMDAEMLAMFQHFMQGFEISPEALALDMIHLVGPGGHHFGTAHTQERYTSAFYASTLGDRTGYETWLAAGAPDAARRANVVWKDILAAFEPPPLDPAIEQALSEFVARRSRELAGVNLYD
ncbi:MAG: trimethylamine methyltransferase family protein [Chloroflexi bacterium]|nr:trimethylamine methyltransferase family protein [Chloroflexota bacterium]